MVAMADTYPTTMLGFRTVIPVSCAVQQLQIPIVWFGSSFHHVSKTRDPRPLPRLAPLLVLSGPRLIVSRASEQPLPEADMDSSLVGD
jgi:hypothetical protein